jgi:hypothetical protein
MESKDPQDLKDLKVIQAQPERQVKREIVVELGQLVKQASPGQPDLLGKLV